VPEVNLRREFRRQHPNLALFLDFDGTLADLALRPEAVEIEPWLPDVLDRLRNRLDGALAIVTGRPVSYIEAKMAPHRFDIAGLHGAEFRLSGHYSALPVDASQIRRTIRWLNAETRGTGLVIEEKKLSVALHWRLVPHLEEVARSLMKAAALQLGDDFRLQEGKFVLEAIPVQAIKSGVIEKLMSFPAYASRTPIFIGDDATDEEGFAVVRGLAGYSVKVGNEPTLAQYRIANPTLVRKHLRFWSDRTFGELRIEDEKQ
jgi:trehalose 6-phosphate phosphatase